MAWTGDQIIKFSKSDKDVGTDNRLSQTDKRLSVTDNIISTAGALVVVVV